MREVETSRRWRADVGPAAKRLGSMTQSVKVSGELQMVRGDGEGEVDRKSEGGRDACGRCFQKRRCLRQGRLSSQTNPILG